MPANPEQNVKAALLYALCGFSLFSIGDGVVKSMAGDWPSTGVAALRLALAAIGCAILIASRHGVAGFAMPLPRFQLLRGISMAIATGCFFWAVYLMPLATALSIVFISPQITALLSAVFLGERIGRATVFAGLLALAGVFVILRPTVGDVGWAALLPLASAFALAGIMIGNRLVAGTGTVLLQQFWMMSISGAIMIAVAAAAHMAGVAPFVLDVPHWSVPARAAFVAAIATVAHGIVFLATSRASAATILPMSYVQILLAIVIGVAFFDDIPDFWSLLGAAMVIGAGLWLWAASGEGKAPPSGPGPGAAGGPP